MKKLLILFLILMMVVSLAACQLNNAPVETSSSPETEEPLDTIKLNEEDEEFRKTLEPVSYREGEAVQSSYYKTVAVNGENYYEVRPVGEDALRMPVNETVIYGIDSGDCLVEKVCLKLSNGEEITQYRLHVTLETGNPVGENEPNPVEPESGQDADKIS